MFLFHWIAEILSSKNSDMSLINHVESFPVRHTV